MKTNEIKVLAVIPTIFPKEQLIKVCEELKFGTLYRDCDILVVYNTETDYAHVEPSLWSPAMEERLHELSDVVYPHVNMNWLHSCNMGLLQGVRENYSHVLLLNDDVQLSGKFLEEMIISATRTNEGNFKLGFHPFGITAPLYNGFWGEKQREVPWKNLENRRPAYHVNYVDGTCMLVSTELVEKIGVLDSSFGSPGWGADVDYCFRARQADALVKICPNAYVSHDKEVGGYSAVKVYRSATAWHQAGLKQARMDLERKYGKEFRKLLGLPPKAYIETKQGLQAVRARHGEL